MGITFGHEATPLAREWMGYGQMGIKKMFKTFEPINGMLSMHSIHKSKYRRQRA